MRCYPHPVFNWDAPKLSTLSLEQLSDLREAIIRDPASASPDRHRSIELYSPAARRKLSALSWAVTYKLREKAS